MVFVSDKPINNHRTTQTTDISFWTIRGHQGTSYWRAPRHVLSTQPCAAVLLIITSGASPASHWGASVVHARHGRRRHDGGVSRAAHSPRSRRSPYRRAVHTPPVVAPRPVVVRRPRARVGHRRAARGRRPSAAGRQPPGPGRRKPALAARTPRRHAPLPRGRGAGGPGPQDRRNPRGQTSVGACCFVAWWRSSCLYV